MQNNELKKVIDEIANDYNLNENSKNELLLKMSRLKNTKLNILITGATGCGKSSTINALFGENVAKVGQGATPETMTITRYEHANNIILWDSPGLGDGKEADERHSRGIIAKLNEKDNEGNALIDLVLVILDGSTRDLGTSYDLINRVIIPNLGTDTNRLLVAINQCDMAMKGRNWNFNKNEPEQPLIDFLEDKVRDVRNRIKEATGVNVEPIYYSAGYKDGNNEQLPYNLSKLLYFIVSHTRQEKRFIYQNNINTNEEVWEKSDNKENYHENANIQIKKSWADKTCQFLDDVEKVVKKVAKVGTEVIKEVGKILLGKMRLPF